MTDNIQKLDRQYQRELLEEISRSYPKRHGMLHITQNMSDGSPEEAHYIANMKYLEGKGLIDSGIRIGANGHVVTWTALLTDKGARLLQGEEDAGVPELHEDILKAMFYEYIQQTHLTPPEKKRWTDAIREIPYDSIKHVGAKLTDAGWDILKAALLAAGISSIVPFP